MAGDDLKDHATSSQDFYALLGVTFETSESDIRRAWRRTALKYHPDKNPGNTEALEKFHLLQIAQDVLTDPTAKAVYDNARRARKEKEERDAAFEGKRRKMKEDLERRESGFFKRKREDEDAEQNLEREIKRLAEDGRRRRKEREDLLNRERLEEEEALDRGQAQHEGRENTTSKTSKGGSDVPEIDRTVKVRWAREGSGEHIDRDRLSSLFTRFGKVESAFLLKDKRQRLGDRAGKTLVATGVIVFTSVVGSHAAVEDASKQTDNEFRAFDSVFWASNQEPDFLRQRTSSSAAADASATTPSPIQEKPKHQIPGMEKLPSTPLKGDGLRKVPSFASFSGASLKTPIASPVGQQSISSPSLAEMTMIRLKNAEKKKLEAQIRREDAAASDEL